MDDVQILSPFACNREDGFVRSDGRIVGVIVGVDDDFRPIMRSSYSSESLLLYGRWEYVAAPDTWWWE